jgi:hypothetical protein
VTKRDKLLKVARASRGLENADWGANWGCRGSLWGGRQLESVPALAYSRAETTGKMSATLHHGWSVLGRRDEVGDARPKERQRLAEPLLAPSVLTRQSLYRLRAVYSDSSITASNS